MFQTHFLPILKKKLKICQFLKCLPFQLHNQRFVKVESPRHIRIFRTQCVLSLLYISAMFLNLCFGPLTPIKKLQGIGFFLAYLLASVVRWNYSLDVGPIQIIHAFLDFEKTLIQKYPPRPLSLGGKGIIIFTYLAEISISIFPMLQFVLLTYSPCMPPFLLSMMSACGKMEANCVPYWGQILVHLFEAWMAWHILFSGSMWMIYILFVGIACILDYIGLVEGQIQIIENHADKDSCIQLYRCIHILEKSLNDFLMDRILPLLMFGVPAIQVVGLFVCINLSGDIAMPGFLVFPLMGVDAVIINVLVFTLASFVNSASQKVLTSMMTKAMQLSGRGLIVRQLRGCSALKIKFGSNFIDRGTPLQIQNFCINQTVSLSLIKANRKIEALGGK